MWLICVLQDRGSLVVKHGVVMSGEGFGGASARVLRRAHVCFAPRLFFIIEQRSL